MADRRVHRRRRTASAAAAVTAVAVLVAVAGCGPAGSSAAGPRVAVQDPTASGVPLLTNAAGWTLYLFAPDRRRAVTCVQVCQGNWPPLRAAAGAAPRAAAGVSQRLLGTAADPDGGRVVTYDGWPLYTYAGDDGPGRTRGHAVELNGGVWYAVTAHGSPA